MERVAAAAAVSKVTLYKYFADKADLLLALVREHRIAPAPALVAHHQTLLDCLHEVQREADVTDVVEETILQLLQDATERRTDAFFRLLVEIALDQPGLLARIRQEAIGAEGEQVWTNLGRLLAERLPVDIDGQVLGQLLFATAIGYMVVQPVILGEQRVSAERLAAGLATLLRGRPCGDGMDR